MLNELFEYLKSGTGPGGSWMIEAGQNTVNYATVAEELQGSDHYSWESDGEKQRAIKINRMVVLHWYDSNPVGSYKIAAPDIESLARFVLTLRPVALTLQSTD